MTAHAETGQPIVDPTWLSLRTEEIIEPDFPIVDAHHHVWDVAGYEYGIDDLLADLRSGHRVDATIFVQSGYGYRSDGPEALRPVGETGHVAAIATEADRHHADIRVCAGIVGYADLRLGDGVDKVLQAHISAGGGRFRGIRQNLANDKALTRHLMPPPPPKLAADPAFRRGFARLSAFDLSFDAWLFHPQISELTALAGSFPDTPIVLDHFGGILGIGAYSGHKDDVFKSWQRDIRALAEHANVSVKLGGFGLSVSGLDLHRRTIPPSSHELAEAWRPYVETCIEAFGTKRCMFESNFPVDKAVASYAVLWNACKLLAAGASADEKADLFHGTARRFYAL